MRLKLTKKQPEAGDAVSFFFEPEEPVEWQAGQYGTYKLPHQNADDRKDRRFFTISAAPFEGNPRITTRISEQHSSFKDALNDLPIGGEIELLNVGGDFVIGDPGKPHVWVAGGIGITPFRAIAKQLDHDGQPLNVTLLYAGRADAFVFKAELDELAAKHSSFKIRYFVEPERITQEVLADYAKTDATIWLSGPEPMVESFEEQLKTGLGVPEAKIKTDFFPGYTAI